MRFLLSIIIVLFSVHNLTSLEPELFSNANFDLKYNLKYIHDYTTPAFEFNGEIYLTANNGSVGDELFKIDTLNDKLKLIIDLQKYGSSNPFILTALGDKFIFVTDANDKAMPTRFWSTDGTEEGTTLLFEVEESEPTFSLINNFIIRYDKLFIKTTGVWEAERYWITDGSKAGTYNLTDEFESFHIDKMYLAGDQLVFLEPYHSESKIGVLDTNNKLTILGTFNIGYYTEVLSSEDIFYFNVCKKDQQFTRELWVSDGTKNGTEKIFTAEDTEKCLLDTENAALFGNTLYFNIYDEEIRSVSGWITDGTNQGTINIKDAGFISTRVWDIRIINKTDRKVFLNVSSEESARSLWSVDLQGKITENLIKDWPSYVYNNNIKIGNLLYFKSKSNIRNKQIWQTDGTYENTKLFLNPADIVNKDISILNFLGSYSDSLLFFSTYSQNNVEIFSINLFNNHIDKLSEFESSSNIELSHIDGITFIINNINDTDILYYNYNGQTQEITKDGATNESPYLGAYFYSSGDYIYYFADYEGDEKYELYRFKNPASGITSVEDKDTNEIRFYPNPTNNSLMLELEESTDISIVDINGTQVLNLPNFKGGLIDVSSLISGFYSITNSTGKLIGKFIKTD